MLNCMAAQHAAERAAAKLHALEAQAAANHEVRGREREREGGKREREGEGEGVCVWA
jgi:hypothetical protein